MVAGSVLEWFGMSIGDADLSSLVNSFGSSAAWRQAYGLIKAVKYQMGSLV